MKFEIKHCREPQQIPKDLEPLVNSWDSWTFKEISEALARSNYTLFYASNEQNILGALFVFESLDYCDIIYLFTSYKFRRNKVALHLLEALESYLQNKDTIHTLFLEVKEQNNPAQRLYESFGMSQIGSRRAYYKDGSNALIYRKELGRTHASNSQQNH